MKNAINYTALPTTSNGTLKAGIWLTSLNSDLIEGDIIINSSTLPDTIEVKVNGTAYQAETLPFIIASFERCYGSKAQMTIEEHVKLASEGFVTPLQKNTTVVDKSTKTPFSNAKSVLSAVQYSNNCIKLGLQDKSFSTVAALVTEYYSLTDKTTKADLHNILAQFVDVFMTEEQHSTFVHMVDLEEQAARKFEALTAGGFTSIGQVSEGMYTATLSMADIANVSILTDAGFTLVSTVYKDNAFSVSFKDNV